MADKTPIEFVLGIDLGTNSLGWAVVGLIDGEPANLLKAGVRIFEAGVNIDPKSGKEETLNAQRRGARLHRRQLWRRARRLKKVFNLLQRFHLLPPTEDVTADFRKAPAWRKPRDAWKAKDHSEARQDYLSWLDHILVTSPWFTIRHPICALAKNNRTPEQQLEFHRLNQLLPYILRAAAVEGPLDPHFLGRAIYHLAQRRGFWSNRKRTGKKDEKPGEVKEDIRALRAEMGDQTLGQHFAGLVPFERRIRDRWTARDMYQTEFKRICQQQATHPPDLLKDEGQRVLYDAIFDQRPMKLNRGLVGQCEFEANERRAPAYLMLSQRFRLLQVVNNFEFRPAQGNYQPLPKEKRDKLISALERCSEMSFKNVRELLGLSRRDSINLQRDKEEAKMPGNDTGAQFSQVFNERWFDFSPEEQGRIVVDAQSILSVRDADERRRRAEKYLLKRGASDLDKGAREFLGIALEAGYASLSTSAIKRFMPLLERGFRYGALAPHYKQLNPETVNRLIKLAEEGTPLLDACEQVLTAPPDRHEPFPFLPPVTADETRRAIGAIRNPIVVRSLTELRKVVNGVIEKMKARPTRIHVELLRELRKGKDAREKIWKENFSRERENDAIRKKIRDEAHIARPSMKDVEKHKLWVECGNICAYCRTGMSWPRLFGDDSEYQIDHIIPWKRCLDDSFPNKVLCHAECNHKKGDRTPYEWLIGDSESYHAALRIVENFKGDKDMREAKVSRFRMDHPSLEEFLTKRAAQQFNDSAYASRLAADYLGLLYGGRNDEEGNVRVQVRPGGLTRFFREAWNLNSILGDGEHKNGGKIPKPRHDHRHHAIDAVVIAVADQAMVQRLNNAAKRGWLDGPGRFGNMKGPWDVFRDDLKAEVLGNLIVSHRVSGKVSGGLHKDKNYSAKDLCDGFRRLRIPVREPLIEGPEPRRRHEAGRGPHNRR